MYLNSAAGGFNAGIGVGCIFVTIWRFLLHCGVNDWSFGNQDGQVFWKIVIYFIKSTSWLYHWMISWKFFFQRNIFYRWQLQLTKKKIKYLKKYIFFCKNNFFWNWSLKNFEIEKLKKITSLNFFFLIKRAKNFSNSLGKMFSKMNNFLVWVTWVSFSY